MYTSPLSAVVLIVGVSMVAACHGAASAQPPQVSTGRPPYRIRAMTITSGAASLAATRSSSVTFVAAISAERGAQTLLSKVTVPLYAATGDPARADTPAQGALLANGDARPLPIGVGID